MTEEKTKKTIKKKRAFSGATRKKISVKPKKEKRGKRGETQKAKSDEKIKRVSLGAAVLGRFVDPDRIVSDLDIREGMKAADLGAGTGYFAFPVARKIGDGGTLFAVDVVREKLEAIESQARIFGISNIAALRGDLTEKKGSNLPDQFADWAFLVNVLFQNNPKKPIVSETFRILKKGGKVLVLEWNEKKSPIGPGFGRRVSREELEMLFAEAGFIFEKEINVGDFHYGIIFGKK